MEFLVIGCGSIGQRHIRNLKLLGHNVSGVDSASMRAEQTAKQYGIEIFLDLKRALKKRYDGALICSPTRCHVSLAVKVASKGIHLFIEKPLSDRIELIEELRRVVAKKRLVALVGCNTRFFPSFKLVKKLIDENAIGKVLSVRVECGFYLPYWHPYEDYRNGYSAKKKLGGGVILDDIHEIDSLYWFFGKVKEIFCFAGKVSELEIDTEDIAEIFMKFKSGVVAQIHLDYLQRTYRRNYEFIGEKGLILWDYISQDVELFSASTNQKKVFQENINTSREKMFIDEMKHFVNCINGKEKSINDLDSAREILKIALICQKSAKKKLLIYL